MSADPAPLSVSARLRAALSRFVISAWMRTGSRLVGRLFHYDLMFRTDTFATLKWAGHPIWQNPVDLWTIQETIFEMRPALLIETGTNRGGSALFYAQLMDVIGAGRIVTIDIEDMIDVSHPRIQFVHGSSVVPEVADEAREAAAAADGPVMVILDADHVRDHVARGLEIYAPLVTPGSLLLSQDGVIDQMLIYRGGRPGPMVANRDFLARHAEFEYDQERNERFGLTQHPLGWMRRTM